jgi:hypothetical protein
MSYLYAPWLLSLACALPLLDPSAAAARDDKGKSGVEDFLKAVHAQKDADSKLKSAYQELVNENKHGGQIASSLAASKTQLANLPLTAAYWNARDVLHRQIRTMESEQEKTRVSFAKKEGDFKADEKKLLETINQTFPPILKEMNIGSDKKGTEAVMSMFDLFVFSDYKEIRSLKIGSSFQDQEAWQAAGSCLATTGTTQLPELKKILVSTRSAPAKYAVVAALAEIGAEADKVDKGLYDAIYRQSSLLKASGLERNEKDARQRLLQKAMDALRPDRK